jgi:hypothetical protein
MTSSRGAVAPRRHAARAVSIVAALFLSVFGRVVRAAEPSYQTQLSDHGYGQLIVFADRPVDAVRTTHLYLATFDEACERFCDTAFLLNDNQVEHFARVGLEKITAAMRLGQPLQWLFVRDSSRVRENLSRFDKTPQFVGIKTTLTHTKVFVDSEGPPRSFIDGAARQDCFFAVTLQYYIVFDAPKFIHIFVVDTKPRCGSSAVEPFLYPAKKIDGAALSRWINNLGIERAYRQSFGGAVAEGGASSSDDVAGIQKSDAYARLLKLCREKQHTGR